MLKALRLKLKDMTRSLLLQKEEQITALRGQLSTTEIALQKAKDDAYEAKPLQIDQVVDTSTFEIMKANSPRPVRSDDNSSSSSSPSAKTLLQNSSSDSYASVVSQDSDVSSNDNSSSSSTSSKTSSPSVHSTQSAPNAELTHTADSQASFGGLANFSPPLLPPDHQYQQPPYFPASSYSSDKDASHHPTIVKQSRSSIGQSSSVPSSQYSHQHHERSTKHLPTVVVIGNSHLQGIDPSRLVPQAEVTYIPAFTTTVIEATMNSLSFHPDCIVIHEITNTIKHVKPDEYAHGLLDIVTRQFTPRFKNTKFVILLGLPRMDDNDLNFKTDMVNVLLHTAIRNGPLRNVSFCDNSNFMRHRYIKSPLIHPHKFHLSVEGTKLLCSNLRGRVSVEFVQS